MKEWVEYQMRLYCTHFNFCRGHGGLRYKDERGIECKNTPAREAEITESIWTLKELLKFRCFKNINRIKMDHQKGFSEKYEKKEIELEKTE